MTHSGPLAGVALAVALLFLVAAAVSVFSRAFKLPFTVMLVLAGVSLAQAGEAFGVALFRIPLSEEVILFLFLPTLIFEAAYRIEFPRLRDNALAILLLAVPGLLLSTAVIGAAVNVGAGLPLLAALLLGAVLSATDPVAVIATFHQLGAPKDLRVLVEGESLFNDATAIVTAQILVGLLAVGSVTVGALGHGVVEFLVVFFGGLGVGVALACAAGWALGRLEGEPAVEISIMIALAYLAFVLAEAWLHVSGVMATLAAGLVMGGWGRAKITPEAEPAVERFWDFAAYVANALIFLLVGINVDFAALNQEIDVLLWAVAGMLVARALVVFGLTPLACATSGAPRIGLPTKAVMYWGGLRGAVALAVALSLQNAAFGDRFLAVVMGAVLFTLVVQGLTIAPLIQALGLDQDRPSDAFARLEAKAEAAVAAARRLPAFRAEGMVSLSVAERLAEDIAQDEAAARSALDALREGGLRPDEERRVLRRRGLAAERAALGRLWADRHVDETVYRRLRYANDRRIDAARHGSADRDLRRKPFWTKALIQKLPGAAARAFARDYETAWATWRAASAAVEALDASVADGLEDAGRVDEARQEFVLRRDQAKDALDAWAAEFPDFVASAQERLGRRLTYEARIDALQDQVESGATPEGIAEGLIADNRRAGRAMEAVRVRDLALDPLGLLRAAPIFAGLDAAALDALAKRLKRRLAAAEEVIVAEGAAGDSMFWIARGVVAVERRGSRGDRVRVATLMAGDFFGEHALLAHAPRNADCRATTPCELYELTARDFFAFETAAPEAGAAVRVAAATRSKSDFDPIETRF